MTFSQALSIVFYVAAVASFFCFIMLIVVYWKRERMEKERLRKTRADIGDITIIFQTMRDIVDQQKTLAREFNEDLDRKMASVKQVLTQSLSRNEELYERQRTLGQQLVAAEAELESIQRQLAGLDGIRRSDAARQREAAPESIVAAAKNYVAHAGHDAAPFPPLAGTEESEFPPASPQKPANPERARQAFRALLDLDEEEPSAALSAAAPDAADNDANPELAGMAPLQRRVEKYAAAGMTIAEIARELGIGKGEVRLMMSLKQQH